MNMPYSRLCAGSVRPWFVETLLWFSPSQAATCSSSCGGRRQVVAQRWRRWRGGRAAAPIQPGTRSTV